MQSVLKEKLWAYIVHNNPDLMFDLQETYSVNQYLENKIKNILPKAEQLLSNKKPFHGIIEICLDTMTEELKPSRFLFTRSILQEEFPNKYMAFVEEGETTFQTLQIMEAADGIFESFSFSNETIIDLKFRQAIIATIHHYLL